MKFWHLTIRDDADLTEVTHEHGGWWGYYTHWHGAVVAAESEETARLLLKAEEEAYGEPTDAWWWLEVDLTSCEALEVGASARLVLADVPTG